MRRIARGRTDVGQQREHNEDCIHLDDALGLYLVCDGMGGAAAGEVASAMCVDFMRRTLEEGKAVIEAWARQPDAEHKQAVIDLIQRGVRTASAEIHALAEREPEKRGMGTTLAMMLVGGDRAICAHVGDSRIYLIRNGEAHALTRDHSLVQEMVREGIMSPEEAETSRIGNVITRAVGLQADCIADTLHVEIAPGDRYVLCSDGLTGHVKADEIAAVITELGIERAVDRLIELANERGGSDNISVIVLGFDPEPSDLQDGDEQAAGASRPSPSHKLDLLESVPLFSHMNYRERMALLDLAEARNYAPEEVIIAEGERSQEMFVLLSGSAVVEHRGQRIATLETGAHFGEMCMVEDAPRSATIKAITPCHVLVFNRERLYGLMRRNQTLAVKLLWALCQSLAARLRATSADLSVAYEREGGAGFGPSGDNPALFGY